MLDSTTVLFIYLAAALVSALLSVRHLVAILEYEGEDTHYAYGYMLMWAVLSASLVGILVSLVYHMSKIKKTHV